MSLLIIGAVAVRTDAVVSMRIEGSLIVVRLQSGDEITFSPREGETVQQAFQCACDTWSAAIAHESTTRS